MSPKNQRELDAVDKSLSIELLKIQKVFDRLYDEFFHLIIALSAVWNDLPALFHHFDQCSQDLSRNSKERSKLMELCKKNQSWFFLAEVAMLRDALGVLKQFSHYLPSDQVSITKANLNNENLKEKLICLKDGDGQFLYDFFYRVLNKLVHFRTF